MMLNGCGAHPLVVVGCSLFAAPIRGKITKKCKNEPYLPLFFTDIRKGEGAGEGAIYNSTSRIAPCS